MKRLALTLFLLTAFCGMLRAQPDPATVYAWFKADAGVLTNASGNVTNWLNQAVTGVPASRNLDVPGAAPAWIPAAVGTNPVVRFSGTANIFATVGNFGTIATNRSVVACFKLSGTNGGFLFDGSTHSGMTRAQIRAGSWQVGIQPSPIGNSGNADPNTLGIVPGVWQVQFFNFEPVTGGTRITHSMFNGASVTYTNSNTNGLGGLILGENASQNLGLAADIGEFLVYDRSLTTNEQQTLGAYLTNKWQVTVLPPLPATTDVYAWYAGDSSLNVSGDNYSVTSWSNLGVAATNATYTKAGRDLINLTSAPQKVYLRFADNSPAGAVRFDGNDGIWAAKGVWGILTNNRTITILARISNSVPQGFLFDSTSTAPGYTRALVLSNNWQVSTTSGTGTVTTNVTTGVWQVHSFVVSTNSGTIQHFIDGALVGSVPVTPPSYLSGLMIGANVSQASGIWADVAECLVFNTALDDSARTNVESYLAAKWAGVMADTNPPAPPAILPFVRVFTGGVDVYTCFRIPAIITTTNGTLIAMSDGRIGGCGDIPTPLDLVIKRSFDNGATWGPLQVVTDYGSNPSDTDDYPAYGLTNISRVSSGDAALLLDRTNGRIWTLYDNGGVSGGRKIKLEMKYSDDDGVTWSPRIDVEAANPGIRPSGGEFLAGPGNGIQITQGPHVGRLIFPVYHYKTPALSMVIYSDDHGVTWTRGAAAGTGGGESQVAETPGGGLIISMRDNNFAWSGVRTFARSTDAGETWGAPYTDAVIPPTMADPACQGNIYRLTTTNDSNASRIVHANAASSSGRVNMTLRISYDEGQTWPVSNQVYAAGSAYSSVTKLANGDIGLLFEKDPYGNLDYARRSIFEITGGADSLPAYDVWAGQHFTPVQLSNPGVSGPNADADGDGHTNFEEFMAGTDPLSAASFLQLNVAPASGGAQLSFPGVSNKSYTIQYRDSLNSGSWTGFTNVNTLPGNITISVPVSATNNKRFFRLATPQLP